MLDLTLPRWKRGIVSLLAACILGASSHDPRLAPKEGRESSFPDLMRRTPTMATARYSYPLGVEDEDDIGPSSSSSSKNPELALLVTTVVPSAAAGTTTTAGVVPVISVSIDDIPVSILYLGIGFAVVLTAYLISWLLQAVAFVLDLLLAVAFPLSIGCVLIWHDALQHHIPASLQQLEQVHGTKLLLASSLFTLVFMNEPEWYLPDYHLWIVLPLWIVKSFVVVAIVSRRAFLLVQHLQLKKELPRQLWRNGLYREEPSHRQQFSMVVDGIAFLVSIGFELASLSDPVGVIPAMWYGLASLGGATVALRRAWRHLRRQPYSTTAKSTTTNGNGSSCTNATAAVTGDHPPAIQLLPVAAVTASSKDGNV
jgi:hypothetical protein